jgi:pimeloyl-[acyl-carrier protein] synthase
VSVTDTGAPAARFSDVDVFGPHMIADPYPTYQQLVTEGPFYLESRGTWVTARYADVQRVLRDPSFGRQSFGSSVERVFGPGPVTESFKRWILFMNPPDHTRIRSLVSKAFTPRATERLRASIQQVVDDLIDPMAARGSFDLIAELAYPLPVVVICELLGIPEEDRNRFHEWSSSLAEALDAFTVSRPDIIERSNVAASGLTAYFHELVAKRRLEPRDDLLSAMIAAEEQGDRLTEDELLATSVLLFFAGHETTVNLIGTGVRNLVLHPEQCAKLRANPALIQGAVEELLRFDGPVQRTGRTVASESVELGGATLKQGDPVVAFLAAANRDPAQFASPDDLDITRPDNQHLAFGAGIHYCVGAPLARVEAQIAINTLLRRFPTLALQEETPTWRETAIIRGLTSLPLGT